MATSGTKPPAWDLRRLSRLILGFLCSTIALGMSEVP